MAQLLIEYATRERFIPHGLALQELAWARPGEGPHYWIQRAAVIELDGVVERRITFGRSSDLEAPALTVSDATVSRRHAEVAFEDGHWTVRDLQSSGGIRLNDQPGSAHAPLRNGDFFSIGARCCRVTFVDDERLLRSQSRRTLGFAQYDRRDYETHAVVEGYARWAPIYDEGMDDRLDLDLFARSPWLRDAVEGASVVDLACGTGRVGRWLQQHGAKHVVGVDLSSDMLANASHYDAVVKADICATGLERRFDGATSSMALCHVADLASFFEEAARLLEPGGFLFIVDFHPFFLMNGTPTHFDDPQTGTSHAVQDHVHAVSDYFRDARPWFDLVEFDERFVDDDWIESTPGFAKYRGWPVTLSAGYVKSQG